MIKIALGFVVGAWLLQQQSSLPSLPSLSSLPSLPIIFLLCMLGIILIGLAIKLFHLNVKPPVNNQFNGLYKQLQLPAIALFLLALGIGFLWANVAATQRIANALPIDWQQKNILIEGIVASMPEQSERGLRFRFDIEKILTTDNSNTLKLPRHLSLNLYDDTYHNGVTKMDAGNSDNLANKLNLATKSSATKPYIKSFDYNRKPFNLFHAGQRWQLTVRLKRPHGTYNPHGYDFEAWALAENMRATGNIVTKSAYTIQQHFVYKPRYIVEAAREKIGNAISTILINKPYAGVIRALVVGDDSQIQASDWNIFLRTGINHLMSISGLHITMLAGLAYAITAFVWRRQPRLVLWLPTPKAATIMGLGIALMYALLAGMSVPTQRTLFMLLTFALALIFGRQMAISRALALAVIVVVIIDPWAVNAAGFWLSFCAVALISYVSVGRLNKPHWLREALHTQWAVTIGLLPFIIALFGQTSIVSPIANALAIPIISLIVVPLSILGSLFSIDMVLQAAHWFLSMCMLGLIELANLPTWQQAAPPIWAVILSIVGIIWLLLPRGFPQRWLGIILLLPLFFVKTPKLATGDMQVAVLDVGQGLSVLIKTANHHFLYDTGPTFNSQSDAGGRIVVPYLRGEGIARLDGLVISHQDNDHSGGAKSVLQQIPVKWLASSFDTSDLIPINSTTKQLKCVAGQQWVWDKVTFSVLYPSLHSYQNSQLSDNNRSCVIKISSAAGSLLLTGDIEREAEMALLEEIQSTQDTQNNQNNQVKTAHQLKSDVLIAPHHGSKTSSTVAFLQTVNAKHVVFTVGYLNRFKHPKPMIEKRYEESGAIAYRSDYSGAVVIDFIKNQPPHLQAWRQLQPKYWHDHFLQPS